MNPQSPTVPALDAFPPLFGSTTPQALTIDLASFAPLIVLLAFVVWLGFSLAVAYHWFRYAHRSWLTVPALTVHVFVSGALILYAIAGLA